MSFDMKEAYFKRGNMGERPDHELRVTETWVSVSQRIS